MLSYSLGQLATASSKETTLLGVPRELEPCMRYRRAGYLAADTTFEWVEFHIAGSLHSLENLEITIFGVGMPPCIEQSQSFLFDPGFWMPIFS